MGNGKGINKDSESGMERTVQIINDEILKLQDQIDKLREERFKLKIGDYNFAGKYIKYHDEFMFVYDMFPTTNNQMLLRGVAFSHEESEFWDGSFFSYSTYHDRVMNIDELQTIEVITENEYNKAFEESVEAFIISICPENPLAFS